MWFLLRLCGRGSAGAPWEQMVGKPLSHSVEIHGECSRSQSRIAEPSVLERGSEQPPGALRLGSPDFVGVAEKSVPA